MEGQLDNNILDILLAPEREPDWLVPDFSLQGAAIVLAGEPGAGKSYVSYTKGLAIAAGIRALGGMVPPGEPRRVLYYDQENSAQDLAKYIRRSWFGICAQNNLNPENYELLEKLASNFYIRSFQLGGDDWADVVRYEMEIVQPHLVVFDTATPCFNIENENDNSEANQAMKKVRELMRITDPVATALILKHAKMRTERGGRRTIRGAKHWQGAADSIMFQVKAVGRKRKDGLSLTRLEPDKTRAYGLTQTIYITPQYVDETRNALMLTGSYSASREHTQAEQKEEEEFEGED